MLETTCNKNDATLASTQQLNNSTIDNDTSRRITSLRFLLIVLVVFIHNCYTSQSIQQIIDNGGTAPLFVENTFGRWIKLFITFGIARGSVPLFFMFSAFLQAKKDDNYKTLLRKRSKSLLLPFIIWNAIYVFYFGGLKLLVAKIAPQLVGHPENNFFAWTISEWIHNLVGYVPDGNGGLKLPSLAVQFWFIRDLIILVFISPVLKCLIKKFPISFLFFVSAIYVIPVQLYFIVSQALFFYVVGLYWGYYNISLFEVVDKISWKETFFFYLLTFIYTYKLGNGDNSTEHYFMVICSCVILLKLSALIVKYKKLYTICSYLSGFSFFLFAIHCPVLNSLVSNYWIRFFPMKNTFFCLLQYFLPTVLVITIGTTIGIILRKICLPLFKVLNGGR